MGLALTAAEIGIDGDLAPAGEIDVETLTRCRAGDARALRCFVLRYQDQVFAFLSRMTGRGPHVEDLAQEVFLKAYRALPRFELRDGVRMSTWLLTIAVRVVQDARKRRRLELVPLSDSRPPIDHDTPETAHRRREVVEAFERAAAQLSDDQRVVFVLAHFHGLSMAEMAELLGVPENTIKTRLFRARDRLRTLLRSEREAIR